jgi:vacuolar-type H+-ATPase subunit I/STV1
MNPIRGCLRGFALLALMLLSLPGASAGTGASAPAIKCWHNKDGVRECGNMVPPEYAQGGHAELRKSGATREVERAKTPEEIAAERERTEQEQAQRQRIAERAAQDRVLLHTFTTDDDLVLTRDGKVAVIESRIKLLESRVADLHKSRRDLQEQAAQEERSGKGMSESLRQDLERVERQIAEHRQFIADQHRERDEIRARFDVDLKRFRALKTGAVRPGEL